MIEQGALYPGLYRLERQGLLTTSWGISENNRRAKFYRLSQTGKRQLTAESDRWVEMAGVVANILKLSPGES